MLPEDITQLGIKPDKPVIYVLEARAWSSLLVLEQECSRLGLPAPLKRISRAELSAWHSVYSIAPRQPFKAWLNKQPKRSRMLRGIIDTLREYPEIEIQFIPVAVFWGRPVALQKHWLQVLFADSWRLAGGLRKLLTILLHGRNTFVKFSDVISYRGSAHQQQLTDEIIDNLQSVFSNHLRQVRSATLGPDMSHRRTLVRELILKPDVQRAIHRRSAEDNMTDYQASLQAQRYLNEIVANCTNITIQVMQRALGAFWNRFYSGIEVSHNQELEQLSLSHELVYVPCHRSHIDYLLLSYVIYYEGLAIPYIAAGKNLNMPIIGTILRGGGAFFIRRSFRGNELYSTVLFEYVAELVSRGVPIEYFVEGGRSRTGRLLKPKPGMLAMTVRGFLKYRKRPVAFIPVYIGYEKLMEGKAYQAELSGEDKKSETFFNSIRSILRIRGNFGKVQANFGKPVFLNQTLDKANPAWTSMPYHDEERPEWLKTAVNGLSCRIMQHINQAVTVNSINLVSTVLLATAKQSMDEQELARMLDMYQSIIIGIDYSDRLLMTHRNGAEQILRAEELKLVRRKQHELGDIIYLDEKLSQSMTYYRNNILHLMALPSVIACCFVNRRSQSLEDIQSLVQQVYPFIQNELFLIWSDKQLPGATVNVLNVLVEQGLLSRNKEGDTYNRKGSGTVQYSQLSLLARVISPLLEVYYLTLALLARQVPQAISRDTLEKKCRLLAQRVAMIHELNSPDYSDKHLIANFIDTLVQIQFVERVDTDKLVYSKTFQQADRRIRLLMSREMRSNILQMVKRSKG